MRRSLKQYMSELIELLSTEIGSARPWQISYRHGLVKNKRWQTHEENPELVKCFMKSGKSASKLSTTKLTQPRTYRKDCNALRMKILVSDCESLCEHYRF